MTKTIALACDHAGYELKHTIKQYLEEQGYRCKDLGTHNHQNPVDYPDYGFALAECVSNKDSDYGIAICGSGIGICIAVNRNKHIRAALCTNEEMARLAREHNNANILVLGSRLVSVQQAKNITDIFLTTDFAGGRHKDRVAKLSGQSLKAAEEF